MPTGMKHTIDCVVIAMISSLPDAGHIALHGGIVNSKPSSVCVTTILAQREMVVFAVLPLRYAASFPLINPGRP